MAEKEEIIKEKLDYSGLFDFQSFYSFSHSWFKDAGYGVTEEKYSEKVSGNKKDITVEWKMTKEVSDYFKFDCKAKFIVENLTEVEVEINGSKEKMNKGKITIELSGNLVKDPKSKWDTSAFSRFMRDFYDKFVIPARITQVAGMVEGDIKSFKDELKTLLELMGKR